ncbi:MAG: hypothetical protein AAGC67_11680 [Myxococcota bacterium]
MSEEKREYRGDAWIRIQAKEAGFEILDLDSLQAVSLSRDEAVDLAGWILRTAGAGSVTIDGVPLVPVAAEDLTIDTTKRGGR